MAFMAGDCGAPAVVGQAGLANVAPEKEKDVTLRLWMADKR